MANLEKLHRKLDVGQSTTAGLDMKAILLLFPSELHFHALTNMPNLLQHLHGEWLAIDKSLNHLSEPATVLFAAEDEAVPDQSQALPGCGTVSQVFLIPMDCC